MSNNSKYSSRKVGKFKITKLNNIIQLKEITLSKTAQLLEDPKIRTEVLSIFGGSIRYYRRRLALSQEDLAWRIGVHRTYIGGIERGERNLSIGKVLEIAGALKIQPEDLMIQVDEYMGKY